MYEIGGWKYEMIKRLLDITHQVSVLKILSFPDMYSSKYIQCYIFIELHRFHPVQFLI